MSDNKYKIVFYSSIITMMHVPINIRFVYIISSYLCCFNLGTMLSLKMVNVYQNMSG